jgi:feruloyl esterase
MALPFPGATSSRLREVTNFGDNPGKLKMLVFTPPKLPRRALAARYGFAVLAPEQRRANHHLGCFHWYAPEHVTRGAGEACSIASMIGAMVRMHGINPERIYIVGLSAGGAMTTAMLAAYPELFHGGAIVAGLAYGTARNAIDGLSAMKRPQQRGPQHWIDVVRSAAPRPSRWPSVSIWHGRSDGVVHPANADVLTQQWTGLHGLKPDAYDKDLVDGHARRTWRDDTGQAVVEVYNIAGLGHAVPLDLHGAGEAAIGRAGPHAFDAGISAAWRLAQGWGLLGPRAERALRQRLPEGMAIRSGTAGADGANA